MSVTELSGNELRLTIDPALLPFVDTSELIDLPLPWIGQQRAEQAARFGLAMEEAHYNLFVINEVGSGCAALLEQMMRDIAATRPTPPDLCFVASCGDPTRPQALRLPTGQGRLLQRGMATMLRNLAMASSLSSATSPAEIAPLVEQEINALLGSLDLDDAQAEGLAGYLAQLRHELVEDCIVGDAARPDVPFTMQRLLHRARINLAVDNSGLHGAPVIVEHNPSNHSLFGTMASGQDAQAATNTTIHAGSLLRADGGFLLLHLRDLLADAPLFEQFVRWLRSGLVHLDHQGSNCCRWDTNAPSPLPVAVRMKIVLMGTREHYHELQHSEPALLSYFQALVDFSAEFSANAATYQATALFIAQSCQQQGLPYCSAAAVARLLELSHRLAEDQRRLTASFGRIKALILETAFCCRQRQGNLMERHDVDRAWQSRHHRHDYPQQRLCEAIADGEMLISVAGEQVGQVNGLSVIDLEENCFGFPVRVTARTHPGEEGLINIDREVEMSGPIHDKGVLILHSYLAALFAHNAPLAFNASIVFEQEYNGIEGDSASCAELFALISALAGVPFKQGIAVTGALNQHGEILPVGGINEKIEGYFRVCATLGLTGHQGVLMPRRNSHHLMLDASVVAAVDQGLFHLYAADQVTDGLELLSGMEVGTANGGGHYPRATLLGCIQQTLLRYQRSCQAPERQRGR